MENPTHHLQARLESLQTTQQQTLVLLEKHRQTVAALEEQSIGLAHRINELQTLMDHFSPQDPSPAPENKESSDISS